MTADQIRKKYIEFFASCGHKEIPSAPLVPENDPTTLFTSSGMQPLVPYLLGQKHPLGTRLVNSQKSFRSQDIEEVGDNRHTTFFEMLGNWSLGDYFKKEQLNWFYEFLVDIVGLEPDRLFVTVFEGNASVSKDDESIAIWKEIFHTKEAAQKGEKGFNPKIKIYTYDATKNWWSRSGVPENMPAGEPGGPDSEVFYDFGTELSLHENSVFKHKPCHVNCDCGRFLEIGNSVFMQYKKLKNGSLEELPNKNVDFGGGLERIAAASEDNSDIFQTSLFQPIIKQLEKISAKAYNDDEKIKQSFRVIADHVKAATMLAADGVFPSNKEQGYFSRRLLRRAVRYGKLIDIEKAFIADLVPIIAEIYRDSYPEVINQTKDIQDILDQEEGKFRKTLGKGLREFDQKSPDTLNAKLAFWLYETHGFPLELSIEEAEKREIKVENNISEKFEKEKKKHADASRTASSGMFKGGLADKSEDVIKLHTATHLLHTALRKILGNHVQQQGSNITAERLRFDFSHPAKVTDEEIKKVENEVNSIIKKNLTVTKSIENRDSALKSGALAFFKETYPEKVSVYTIGDPENFYSKEFCGGPHVAATGEIGGIAIFKEQSAAAGIRRIYARLKT